MADRIRKATGKANPFQSWKDMIDKLKAFYQEKVPVAVSTSDLLNLKCTNPAFDTITNHTNSFNSLVRSAGLATLNVPQKPFEKFY